MATERLHVDEWLDTPTLPGDENGGEVYAKFFLDYCRLPAWKQLAYRPYMPYRHLFCRYGGEVWRCTGASRLGDVWLTRDFAQETGYQVRVDVAKCSGWASSPGMVA